MGRATVEDVKLRCDDAWKHKENWRSLIQSAMEMAMPQRNTYDTPTEGARKADNVFDMTLQHSLVRLANRLQSDITPADTRWAKFVPGPLVPENAKFRARADLERLGKTMFAAIQVSNFDTVVNEFYLDLGIGTGFMMVLEGDFRSPVRFVAVPESEAAIEEGPWGTVEGVYRKREMPKRLIKRHWPDANFAEKDGEDEADRKRKVKVVEATYYDADADIWYYDVVVVANDNKANSERILEREYEESPWLVTRWIKVAGERQGRGPVIFALPDARTANKVKELILRNAALAVSGVWTAVNDGVLNTNSIRITPGNVIPVGRNAGALGPSLQPLEFGGRFDVAQLVLEDLQMSIKKAMLDNQLPPDAQGYKATATFIIERMKELQQDIGSPFGRIMSEFIRPLCQKVLAILNRQGIINIPRKLLDGAFVDVQVTSPLAMAQNLNDVETTVKWLQIVQQFGQEALILGTKIEDIPEWLADKLGVDTKLVRPAEERDSMQKMAGQMLASRNQAMAANSNQPGNAIPLGGGAPPAMAA